eukprot:TRINITY_DN8686_c0_g2_i4.p1 TRINITY_DN8686_c0_g2~~TRINITY_DN8686_c0_g2_i4.p1  ORF type:complete len:267 (+),score=30.08 TRINITY_DN8686_c0_g2_i4:277-1077(+)
MWEFMSLSLDQMMTSPNFLPRLISFYLMIYQVREDLCRLFIQFQECLFFKRLLGSLAHTDLLLYWLPFFDDFMRSSLNLATADDKKLISQTIEESTVFHTMLTSENLSLIHAGLIVLETLTQIDLEVNIISKLLPSILSLMESYSNNNIIMSRSKSLIILSLDPNYEKQQVSNIQSLLDSLVLEFVLDHLDSDKEQFALHYETIGLQLNKTAHVMKIYSSYENLWTAMINHPRWCITFPLSSHCSGCGTLKTANARFCVSCGQPFL